MCIRDQGTNPSTSGLTNSNPRKPIPTIYHMILPDFIIYIIDLATRDKKTGPSTSAISNPNYEDSNNTVN